MFESNTYAQKKQCLNLQATFLQRRACSGRSEFMVVALARQPGHPRAATRLAHIQESEQSQPYTRITSVLKQRDSAKTTAAAHRQSSSPSLHWEPRRTQVLSHTNYLPCLQANQSGVHQEVSRAFQLESRSAIFGAQKTRSAQAACKHNEVSVVAKISM